MAGLTSSDFVGHLVAESHRFRDVVAAAPARVPVPACPDWDVDDLLWHLAEVQWFWGSVISVRPADPPDAVPDRPTGRRATLDFFDGASSGLADALSEADPTEEAWSWSDDRTVGFTQRRQAHEALIHRLDAEQAAGVVTPLPVDLAADGVAELMEVMHGGEPPDWGSFTPSGLHTAIEMTDAARRIRVATGRFEGVHPPSERLLEFAHVLVVDDGPADAVVRGTAADLDAWLWRRRDDSDISIDGDPAAYAEFRSAVDQPID